MITRITVIIIYYNGSVRKWLGVHTSISPGYGDVSLLGICEHTLPAMPHIPIAVQQGHATDKL